MNTYKAHNVYLIILGLVLLVYAYTSIREIIDPTYHIIGIRYLPRAAKWYFTVYCWYKFLTTAYKIDINESNAIITTSLIKKHCFNKNEIKNIKDRTFFVDIVSDKGSVSVSTLIDGVSNIKHVLQSIIQEASKDNIAQIESRPKNMKQQIMTVVIALLLIAYAVYIELQQIEIHSK